MTLREEVKSTEHPVLHGNELSVKEKQQLIVHGPGPRKKAFQYHSGGVMLSYIFENYNSSSFVFLYESSGDK